MNPKRDLDATIQFHELLELHQRDPLALRLIVERAAHRARREAFVTGPWSLSETFTRFVWWIARLFGRRPAVVVRTYPNGRISTMSFGGVRNRRVGDEVVEIRGRRRAQAYATDRQLGLVDADTQGYRYGARRG
jgi:hypothetical protein